jgi:hypothetical protein
VFNLEQTITEWRRQMLAVGIKAPVPLDELESHLRDDMEQSERSGLDPKQAFEAAVGRMGQAAMLQNEFKKVNISETKQMEKIIITAGVAGVLVGMTIVMPALANYGNEGPMSRQSVGALLLGIVLVLGSAGMAFRSLKKRAAK